MVSKAKLIILLVRKAEAELQKSVSIAEVNKFKMGLIEFFRKLFRIRKESGEAPLYCIFIGQKGVTMGVQVDKYIPRNQTWQDYGGEQRPTYIMRNPFNPSEEHSIVGVDEAKQVILPILINGQPQNTNGYSARVVFQDFYQNVFNQILPAQMEFEHKYFKRNYYLLRKEFSKLMNTLENMSKREEISREILLKVIKDYNAAFYRKHDEDDLFGSFRRKKR